MSLFTDLSEGGGLWDDCYGTIVEAKAVMFDYDGKADPAPGLLMKLKLEDTGEGAGLDKDGCVSQFWSVGGVKKFKPSKDGKTWVPLTGSAKITKNSGVGMLFDSMLKCGFPEATLEKDDLTLLIDEKFKWSRIADTRMSKDGETRKNAAGYDKTVVVVSEYVTADTGKASDGKAPTGEAADAITNLVMELFVADPTPKTQMEIVKACMAQASKLKLQTPAIVKAIQGGLLDTILKKDGNTYKFE